MGAPIFPRRWAKSIQLWWSFLLGKLVLEAAFFSRKPYFQMEHVGFCWVVYPKLCTIMYCTYYIWTIWIKGFGDPILREETARVCSQGYPPGASAVFGKDESPSWCRMHMSSSTAFFVFSRMFCFSKKGAVHGIRIRVPKTRHCGSLELRMTTCMSPNWSSLVLTGCSNIVSRYIHICPISTSLKHGSWHLGKIGVVHCNSAATWFCWDVTNPTTNQRKKRGSHKWLAALTGRSAMEFVGPCRGPICWCESPSGAAAEPASSTAVRAALWKMGEQKGVLATDASLVVPSVVVSWFSGGNFLLGSFLGL